MSLMCECVQDKSGLEMQLGVTAVGLVVFQNNARVNTFSWSVTRHLSNSLLSYQLVAVSFNFMVECPVWAPGL